MPLRSLLTAALLAAFSLLLAAPTLAARPPKPTTSEQLAQAQELLDAGRTSAALTLLDLLLKREPRHARALLLRSTAHCIEDNLAGCRADLEQALALDPTLRQGWLNLGALQLSERRYDEALAAFERAELLDPAAADNGLNQGAVLLLAGQLEAASRQFTRYLTNNAGSAEALYLVSTNYALAGYSALALRHLAQATDLDERSRVRARTDPNFAALAATASFQELLTTDSYRLPPGAYFARRVYATSYQGPDSRLLAAVLDVLQLSGRPFDPRIEATAGWALIWGELRIKVLATPDGEGAVEVSAPANRFTPQEWRQQVERLFTEIAGRLAR